jgi:hypothetical protein
MDAHGRYYDAVRRGNVFELSNTAVQALSVGSTTATGLILYNPSGSGKNLVILDLLIAQATLPAAQFTYQLLAGQQVTTPTTTTAQAIQSSYFGKFSAVSAVALGYSAATVTSVSAVMRNIPGGGAATEASQLTPVFIRDEIAGQIIMAPGTQISLQSLTTAVSVLATIVWEEVPAL